MNRHPIYQLADRLTDEQAALDPVEATQYGVGGHDHEWTDYSPDGVAARLDLFRRHRADLDALPPTRDRWEEMAVRATREYLDRRVDFIERRGPERQLNSIAAPAQDVRAVTDLADTDTEDGWESLIARLAATGEALAGYRQTIEVGRQEGLAVARRQVEAVIEQANAFSGDGSPYDGLESRLANSEFATEERSGRLQSGIAAAKQAYADLADYLSGTYLPSAREEDGWGRERYIPEARHFLMGEIDLDEAYEWAWGEIERLRSAMAEVGEQILPNAGIEAVIRHLETEAPYHAESRADFLSIMNQRLQQAVEDLDGTAFDIPAHGREVTVNIAPPGGPLGAYYVPPSEDWSRPGSVWYSLAPDEQHVPLWENVSTNYHEGFPGHHMQMAVQHALGDKLTRHHKTLLWYSGYGEGWALYSELLMHEMGYLERPEYELGYLASSMLRACRVVIDIGSHLGLEIPEGQPFHPGEDWTYDIGVEMLERYAAQPGPYARSEMTRYLGWPGQAISYKLGEREILRLRKERSARPGFDLKVFHHDILSHPVGLDHLRNVILA